MEELIAYFPKECGRYFGEIGEYYGNLQAGYGITEWNGHIMGLPFPSTTVEAINTTWEPKDGDIIVAAHNKTGTHWTYETVRQILFFKDEKLERISGLLPMPMFYLEAGPASSLELMNHIALPRRVFVTHLPADALPLEKWRKKQIDFRIICVLRNPKDQAVSWYHFSNKFPYSTVPGIAEVIVPDWNIWFKNHISGLLPTAMKRGDFYPDYILSWLNERSKDDVMFLMFENLKNDSIASIQKVADFIREPLDEEGAQKIALETTFKRMKQKVDEGTTEESKTLRKCEMYRKGVVGNWKNLFTVSQSEEMDKIIKEKLKETGIKFIYE